MSESKLFIYNSGGRWFPNPYGEWDVSINGIGVVVAKNIQGDKIKFETQFNLTNEENLKIWELIDQSNLGNISPKRTIAVPEEATHTFKLNMKDTTCEVKILANELTGVSSLKNIKDYIKKMMEAHTNKKVVF
jgi:hypothetical protein